MSEYIVEVEAGIEVDTVFVKDLQEVVRCRDCKYYDDYLTLCDLWSAYNRLAEPDGFCKWGERE